jgi:hypothetical protein
MKIKEIAVILPLGILLVIACTCQSTEPEPTPTPTPEPTIAGVQIITENLNCHEISLEPFNCECYLTGTVRNIMEVDALTVVVKATFFNAYGAKVRDESDITGDLSAGESASYSIKIRESACPSTYEVWANWEGSNEGEGCFIATAAYGTSTAGEIDTLRAFRDEVLLQNSLGSQSVAFYYEVSPPVADFISEHEPLRTLVRELLVEPVVRVVEATGTLWQD